MNHIHRLTKTITLIVLIGLPSTLLSPLFGVSPNQIQQNNEHQTKIQNVIFDLGGVLIETNKAKMFQKLGIMPILRYLFTLHNPQNLKKKLYAVANAVKQLDPNSPTGCDPEGNPLPQLFMDWQTGTYPPELIRDALVNFINENPQFFVNRTEQNLIFSVVNSIFTPEILTNMVYTLPKGIELVRWCKQQGMRVFILSNFDPKGFEIIKKKNPELFEMFDKEDIFVSGKLGVMKPDPQIYKCLLEKHNLDPETCVFFDDQKENINMASQFGINGILVNKKRRWLRSQPDFIASKKRFEELITIPFLNESKLESARVAPIK